MKKRRLLLILLLSVVALPLPAVFNERDLGKTISVLRYELKQEYDKISNAQSRIDKRNARQHGQMVGMMKTCNELSLILYSQNQDFTFDITYALKEATREYEDFNKNKLPFDDIVARLDLEIERYSRLVESLRRLPPQLKDIQDLPDSLVYHNDSVNFDMPAITPEMRRQFEAAMAQRQAQGAAAGRPEGSRPFLQDGERRRPFILDEQGQSDRDSCLFYATSLLKMYSAAKDHVIADSEHYEEASARLKESYDYAQARYKVVQRRIFVEGQDNYMTVLKSFGAYARKAFQDASNKYGSNLLLDGDLEVRKSEWRGPAVVGILGLVLVCLALSVLIALLLLKLALRLVKSLRPDDDEYHGACLVLFMASIIFMFFLMVAKTVLENNFFILASQLLMIFAWLMAAILLSLLIRLGGMKLNITLRMYIPAIVLALIVITFRIIFIPNSVANLLFPPLLIAFFFWQLHLCRHHHEQVMQSDAIVNWITLVVLAATSIIAWVGYVLMSVQILIWWLFQLAAIETVTALYALVKRYGNGALKTRLEIAEKNRPANLPQSGRGEYLHVTWFYDLVKDMVLPILAILSVPLAVWMASGVFDLTSVCREAFFNPFVNLSDSDGNEMLHLSLYKIVLASSLFFVFRYVSFIVMSVYHNAKIRAELDRSGTSYISTNQINFTLANNIIGILIWGTYVVMTVVLLKIPMGAISIIAAGLATGIGLAMKDILNNFIYGIQLMSGRLRVGDWVECDGFRGKVSAISYQSTQIELPDGAVMSFLNTSLFNKNFKNLTRNNHYEFVKIVVGVGYGIDVDSVRSILLEAVKPLCMKDSYGRDIVDLDKGITVAFEEFGESSVDLSIKQFVLVSEKVAYMARAKEAIYKALNSHSVEIPYPQRDIHIISPKQ